MTRSDNYPEKIKVKVDGKEQKHPGGRPPIYNPEDTPRIAEYCVSHMGARDKDLAYIFKVTEETIRLWKHQHPEFVGAIKEGKKRLSTSEMRLSLYQRGLGYEYTEEAMTPQGVVKTLRKHMPAHPTAIMFYLQNVDPENWKNVNRTEHTGRDGGPIEKRVTTKKQAEFDDMDTEELLELDRIIKEREERKKEDDAES